MRVLIATLTLVGGCVATPLPHPPTLDADLVTISDGPPMMANVEGAAGAVSPEGLDLRVTGGPDPATIGPLDFEETVVGDDGSFSATVFGSPSSSFYFEAILEDEDLFLLAVTGGPGGSAVEIDPGGDRDGDDSPDEIDCDPDDPTVGGKRCD